MKYLVTPDSNCCGRMEKEKAEAEDSKGVWHKSDGNRTHKCVLKDGAGEKAGGQFSLAMFFSFHQNMKKSEPQSLTDTFFLQLSYNLLLSPVSFTSPQCFK